jgi:hypothetical protein
MVPHKPIHLPRLNVLAHHGLHHPTGHAQDVESSGQLENARAEASERLLIRTVPLVCGVVFGIHAGHPLIGLMIGLLVAIVLDLRLKERSLTRPWLHTKSSRLPRAHSRPCKRAADSQRRDVR